MVPDVLLLFLLDLGALFCVYKIALGRELLLDGLKRITDGELTYKIPERNSVVIRKQWHSISTALVTGWTLPWKKPQR